MIAFTNYVGTSPGTTTMEVAGMNGLGCCPPGYFGPDAGAAQSSDSNHTVTTTALEPYGTESRLAGLASSTIRWDLIALMAGIGFAGILTFALYKSRRGRLGESRTARVYFAETARTRTVQLTPEVWRKLRELKKDGDTYMASTRNDYLALRPYVRDDD